MLAKTPRVIRRAPGSRISSPRITQPLTAAPAPIPPPVPHYVIPGSHLLDPPYAGMPNPPMWTSPAAGYGTGIPEAPTDGAIYGRQNAAWVQIPETVSVNADVTADWQVTAQTTASDPGTGHLKFNTDAQGDATLIYLSEKTTPGTDFSNWILQRPVKIFIQRKNDSTRIARWNITNIVDNTTWFTLTVTPEGTASGFPLSGNDAVIVLFRW